MSDDDKKTLDEATEAAKKVAKDEKAGKAALEAAAKDLSDKLMPIGAKMYEQAAKDEKPAEDVKADEDKKSEKKDKDGPVEGEVVDDKKEK